MLLRMIREIKVFTDWFGCVLVIPFCTAKVFSKSVTWPSSCFTNVYIFALSASYVTDDTGEGAPELISDLLGPDTFLM